MAYSRVQCCLGLIISLLILSCQSKGPAAAGSPEIKPSPTISAPAIPYVLFPSRNAEIALPADIVGNDLMAQFVGDGQRVAGEITRTAAGNIVRKPLTAPAAGQIVIRSGDRQIGTVSYQSDPNLIDITVDTQEATFPFQILPAEASALAGNRTIRVKPGTSLQLRVPEGNVTLGDTQVDATGNVSSVPGLLTGDAAHLRLEPLAVQLSMNGCAIPVRLQPFETAFTRGSRLIRVIPGIPMALALGDNSILIPSIAVQPNGAVSQANGMVKDQNGTIEPVVRDLRFDPGKYAGTWRLTRYESGFAPGSRTIPIFAGDRQQVINFGDFDNASAPFDPHAPTGAVQVQDSTLTFNLIPVSVDPGEVTVPFRVQPFETGFATGRRTVYLPRIASTGSVSLITGADQIGTFRMQAEGTISDTNAGLTAANGQLGFATVSVRVESTSPRPYRVMPYEIEAAAGSRTIVMVRGTTARMESGSTVSAFGIDPDGTLRNATPPVTIAGSGLSLNL